MKKLIIVDYSNNAIHIHNIDSNLEVTDEYVNSLGYGVNNCYWIAGNVDIIVHKGVLL